MEDKSGPSSPPLEASVKSKGDASGWTMPSGPVTQIVTRPMSASNSPFFLRMDAKEDLQPHQPWGLSRLSSEKVAAIDVGVFLAIAE